MHIIQNIYENYSIGKHRAAALYRVYNIKICFFLKYVLLLGTRNALHFHLRLLHLHQYLVLIVMIRRCILNCSSR